MTDRPDELTLRILAALANGVTAPEAAAACNVSESTLARRLRRQRRAWGLQNNVQVLVEAVRRGLI